MAQERAFNTHRSLGIALLLIILAAWPVFQCYASDETKGQTTSITAADNSQYDEWLVFAEQGDPEAQYRLGWAHASGTHAAKKDWRLAVEWFKKSAESGHVRAIEMLATSYADGLGVSVDKQKALTLFKRAAERGSKTAQWRLARAYDDGSGVKADLDQALYWYEQAAKQGHRSAMLKLGAIYMDGSTVDPDYQKARDWFERAADLNVSIAMYNLAVIHETGKGVPVDRNEALKWWRAAAYQGYAPAQEQLGLMYAHGEGVIQNQTEAYKWLYLALVLTPSTNPEDIARLQGMLIKFESTLSETVIKDGRKRAAEWRQVLYNPS